MCAVEFLKIYIPETDKSQPLSQIKLAIMSRISNALSIDLNVGMQGRATLKIFPQNKFYSLTPNKYNLPHVVQLKSGHCFSNHQYGFKFTSSPVLF